MGREARIKWGLCGSRGWDGCEARGKHIGRRWGCGDLHLYSHTTQTLPSTLTSSHPHILTPSHPHTDPFMVDPMNGELVLVRSLDFETRTAYSLNITVMDGGDPTLYDATLVNVSVQDTNDNTPIFNASSYTADVFEGNYTTTPLRIVTVSHTTEHRVSSGQSLSSPPSLSHLLILSSLSCPAPFSPPLPFPLLLPLPLSLLLHLSLLLPFLSSFPLSFLQVGAPDADSGELGRVTYEIFLGDAGGVFAIGNETGQVWVLGPLDKETVDQYTLTILAEDGGEDGCNCWLVDACFRN